MVKSITALTGGLHKEREILFELFLADVFVQILGAQSPVEFLFFPSATLGGHNAISYAVAHPEQVARLIVIDIPPRMNRQRSPGFAEAARLASEGHGRYTDFEDAVRDARPDTPTVPEANLRYRTKWNLRTRDDGTMQFKYDAKVSALWDPEDLTEKLPQISAPTLLVRAGKGVTLPRNLAEAMAAAIPDCQLVEFADSGHSVPTDRPEELAPAGLDWLARRA